MHPKAAKGAVSAAADGGDLSRKEFDLDVSSEDDGKSEAGICG